MALPPAALVYGGPLSGNDVLQVVMHDVARFAGEYPACRCHSCSRAVARQCTCLCRTVIDLCCYFGPPPALYPCRLRIIFDQVDDLGHSVRRKLWKDEIELNKARVSLIYQRMGQDVPYHIIRALELPNSMMHSKYLTAVQAPEPQVMTSATGQPVSPQSARPAMYSQNMGTNQSTSYQHLIDHVMVARHQEESIRREVDNTNALDQDDDVYTIEEFKEQGHIMDPSHIERSFREVAAETATRGASISVRSDEDDDGCVDL